MKNKKKVMTGEEIDEMVIAHTDDETAWEPPVQVKRSRTASVSFPSSVAERAAFFARIHREKSLESWIKRVVQERLDIEEAAFTGFKKELMAAKGGT